MTFDSGTARKIAAVLATADGGCSSCVRDIADRMAEAFPGHDWYELTMSELYPDWNDPKPPAKPSKNPATVEDFNRALKAAWTTR